MAANESTPLIAAGEKRNLQDTLALALGGGQLRRSLVEPGRLSLGKFPEDDEYLDPIAQGDGYYDDIVTSFVPRFDAALSCSAVEFHSMHVGTTTIFNEAIEDSLDHSTKQWLMSVVGVILQFSICVVFTLVSIYDSIFRSKAVTLSKPPLGGGEPLYSEFNVNSVVIMAAALSVLLGIVATWWKGQIGIFWGPGALKLLMVYGPIGGVFAFTNYLSILVLMYLPPDVFSVLDQGRLLIIGLLAWLVQGKRQSRMSWLTLGTIMFAAIAYTIVRKGEQVNADLKKELSGAGKSQSSNGADVADDFLKGIGITFATLFLSCSAGVFREVTLKQYTAVPFYTQKAYQDFWTLIFAVLNTFYVAPYMASKGIGKVATTNDLFSGWESPWVTLTLVSVMSRSWCICVIVKVFDSMTRQLCAVVTTGTLYFFLLMHSCEGHTDGNDFWCPEGFQGMSLKVAVVDVGVLFAVITYAVLQVEQKKWQAFTDAVAKGQKASAKGP